MMSFFVALTFLFKITINYVHVHVKYINCSNSGVKLNMSSREIISQREQKNVEMIMFFVL
jgi:hypothetical protein